MGLEGVCILPLVAVAILAWNLPQKKPFMLIDDSLKKEANDFYDEHLMTLKYLIMCITKRSESSLVSSALSVFQLSTIKGTRHKMSCGSILINSEP